MGNEESINKYLHPLDSFPLGGIKGEPPPRFTYPFLYTPHPFAIKASEELKSYLRGKQEWQEEISRGKMFGVLVVNTPQLSTFFALWAFSGLLDGSNTQEGFVPPVFDLQKENEYFQQEDAIISRMPDGEEKSNRSRALQMWLFRQFNFLNAHGQSMNLCDIFDKETCRIPPSGAGECCAPKLLQYAYSHHLHPVCMAEFWLGASPKGEIRYDGEYYPACQSKCKPILRHMLKGLDVDEHPLVPMMREKAKEMRVIYDDEYLLAVFKPAGMLAVRGNVDAPSVESVIQETYPDVSGPLIVHRLDMDTSGIMIIAKNKDIHKALQIQFYKHEIRKRYIALLDGIVKDDKGIISLPLSPNALDRPRQMVNHEHGKEAITEYEVLERKNGRTLIAFYPLTGRTHQLRVHAASEEGLGCPIIGDRLYARTTTSQLSSSCSLPLREGSGVGSLFLHAESIDFTHPMTSERIHLEVPTDFSR
ncbi:MAG: RluA family pseudouridine synthase [Bacteroidaceae bacterium]|nr:RluA family pseudouridine synthase [Bacteroidaceae bacterium]